MLVLETIVYTFYPSASDGQSKLIQTNLTEPDVELFMNLTD